MTIVDLANGAAEPLTLAEAKAWCRIDHGDEDALVTLLIGSARAAVEAETGTVLARRGFRLVLDPVPPDGWVRLPRAPVTEISAVTAYDQTGAAVTVPTGDAIAERVPGLQAIRLSPAARLAAVNGVEIDFRAGHAPGEAPPMLLHAMRLILAASYELRAAIGDAVQPGVVPAAARQLMAPYRAVRL